LVFKVSRDVMVKFHQEPDYDKRYGLPRISDSAIRSSFDNRNS
jgi:hypothetical protein